MSWWDFPVIEASLLQILGRSYHLACDSTSFQRALGCVWCGQDESEQVQRDVRQEEDFPAEEEVPAWHDEVLVAQTGSSQPQLGHQPQTGLYIQRENFDQQILYCQ